MVVVGYHFELDRCFYEKPSQEVFLQADDRTPDFLKDGTQKNRPTCGQTSFYPLDQTINCSCKPHKRPWHSGPGPYYENNK